MHVETKLIEHIKPNSRNARKHPAKQVRQIADSIVTFGFTVPLLVSDDGELIAGHGRYQAAKLLGLAEVPVIVLTGLSLAKRRALAIADNKIAENSGWDRQRLAIEIPELTDLLNVEGLDISVLGFEKIEIDEIINVDCETKVTHQAFKIDRKWFKASTVWLLGEHKLICGEARSTADIEAAIRKWQTFSRRTAIHAETGLSFNKIAADRGRSKNAIATK
jgi:hypothetical protein